MKEKLHLLIVVGLLATLAAGCVAPTPVPAEAPPAEEAAEEAAAEEAPAEEAVAEEPAGPMAGGTLKYAETGTFNDFNPWRMSAVNMAEYNQVFSRLLWKDGDGNVILDVAESWEPSEDAKTFTIKLKEGVTWHDGQPVNAQSIVDMYNYTKDEALADYQGVSKITGLLEPIADVVALDEYTVQFQADEPVPYMTDILDYFFLVRIDDIADPEMVQSLAVGTGPLKLTEWVPNQYTMYEKYDDYYMEGAPKLDGWEFQRLEKTETLGLNLESGAVDAVMGLPMSELERFEENPDYVVEVNNNSGSVLNIVVNTKQPPFDDPRVRKALSLSMDRRKMAEAASFGYAEPVSSVFWHPASIAYKEDLVMAHEFDLDEAARLLGEAGVEDLVIDFHPTPRWPEMKIYALIWQQDLAKIGVTMNVNEVENARFYEIGLDPDLLGFGIHPWVSGRSTRDPAVFMGTQYNYRGDPELNRYGHVNPEIEALVAAGAVEPDEAKRQEIYWELNQMLLDDLPTINVMTYPRTWVWHKDVKYIEIDLLGNIVLENTWIDRP
jgi:peptide/nickel transport system substrate-binding protein